MKKTRFQVCAEAFCKDYFGGSYDSQVDERMALGPSQRRRFTATFSKPTPECPVPPAVVRVDFEVVLEDGECRVTQFRVEGMSLYLDPSTPFNEAWFDEVIQRKLALKGLVPVQDAFTETRIPQ
ncbi:hypothetical protein CTAYLR_005888 [Chrysophaeum taylorii]|uniref:Uncharacterized protein n=1 Tax=Chrysophaeum taylorii TaxID=2483200 RepID=A0AAD7UI21_9STRA|nr:hypothetical protein CTAYLR_005861 [Chrysophaeum taylorii]KAJ8614309.1 hypothetical protein CTAYLR_005888 [Chrysophaeum taylorii]